MFENLIHNRWMFAAACLMSVTTLVHIFAGGPEVYAPLRASELPDIARSVLSVVWHMVTLILAGFSLAMFSLSGRHNAALFWLILFSQLGFVALFIAFGIADLGTLWPMPQWIVFSAMPVMMLLSWKNA